MTGNATDALYALVADNPLFEGNYRKVSVVNGVIYKVCIEPKHDEDQNLMEYANFMRFRNSLPAPFRVPNASLYPINGRLILACDFIQGEDTGICGMCWCNRECDNDTACLVLPYPISEFWTDTAWGNAIRNDDGIWIIDWTY